jgi:hypothetical protein
MVQSVKETTLQRLAKKSGAAWFCGSQFGAFVSQEYTLSINAVSLERRTSQ